MTTISSLARLATIIVLPCHFAGAATAAEPEKYPIWWSPSLELESLDKIDERRRKRFWAEGIEGLDVFKDGDSTAESAVVENCVSLDRAMDEGYYPLFSHGKQIAMYFYSVCTALDLLEGARPAGVSHVRDFVMTTEALDYLPAMVDIPDSCDRSCRQYRANERRISLRRFEAEVDIEIKIPSQLKIEGKSKGWFFDVEILARANFNHDGLEDLLVIASSKATEGAWDATTLLLLSRETADSVFWVINANTRLCLDYQCYDRYDEPAALR